MMHDIIWLLENALQRPNFVKSDSWRNMAELTLANLQKITCQARSATSRKPCRKSGNTFLMRKGDETIRVCKDHDQDYLRRGWKYERA